MSNIEGKVVVITGASSGIGEATALLLAQRGAHVVLGARRVRQLESLAASIAATGGSARTRSLDVTSREDMQAFVDFAKTAFGHIDVIVNNAGVMPLSPLSSLKVDEWNQMIDVNIRGVLNGIAAVLPLMEAQGFGQVIKYLVDRRSLGIADGRGVLCDQIRGACDFGRPASRNGQVACDGSLPRRGRIGTCQQHF